ncbi:MULTISPECIES: orotidine-5'-phosphate decarboxylase [Hydrocarboniphaga]|jgi:orotidine-5'-phosphate decarboxylase|uniref:Orotidine 5'-phosphate decarboxylase n=1 Tax=Hydrocarboniphaga effusa AP103 TaxID=1172194 RepID=I8I5L1_9GAMM|nr:MULTISPECIES: orotidine-5'-phosphate decarboxylase [Hydrocarboniphaga]EIT71786.1 orotidine 5'-phosphate decarboxylase [Hydrocarboniphaga effusa AP103]MDZ4080408.1 orotidine-5'-phosphate decarboxylase [Hydrocarboniphaga sp.]
MTLSAIPVQDRLIAALDVPDAEAARALVGRLGDAVSFYKIGMELCMAPGFFELLDWLKRERKKVFVDLKFFDIPETVLRAVRNLAERGADFCTVHGNQSIMQAAAAGKTGDTKVLAVTALTSLDQGDLDDLGFDCDIPTLVLSRARRALQAGCDGVVSSGLEVPRLRLEAPKELICVTPGIRPVENRVVADQKRIMTPAEAIRAGADYLVIGRPIRDAADPRAMALAIQQEIGSALG